MPKATLTCAVVWSDPDLLEVRTEVQFQAWAGAEQAYVTRGELTAFAAALDQVAKGEREALHGGQRDLSYVELQVFEYGLARRLALDVALGEAEGRYIGRPSHARELKITVPLERGTLAQFAAELRTLVVAESGIAMLPLLADWP